VATRASRLPRTATTQSPPRAPAAAGGRLYLFGPGVDLALVAGGLTFALLPVCVAASVRMSHVAFLFLNFVANYPHYMATNYRIYRSRAQIERYKLFSIHLTALFVATAVVAHLLPGTGVPVLYTLYFVWSPYHYTGQNYGITLMYLRRGGVEPTSAERRLLYVACMASFLMYVVFINTDIHTGAIGSLPLYTLELAPALGRGLYLPLLAAGVGAALVFVWRTAARAPRRTLVPAFLLLATQFTWFAVAAGIPLFARELGLGWVSVDAMIPAVAFLHCAQYLGVTAYYAKREHEGAAPFRLGHYFLVVVAGGVFLWLGSTRLLSQAFSVDYGLSFLVMLTLINLHHFAMDGAIWKLRDGRIARLLLAPEPALAAKPAPGRTGGARPAAAVVARAGTPGWRVAAWAAAGVLALTLATTDVLYRVLILQASDLARAGRQAEARAIYERVLRFNPNVIEAIDGLAWDALAGGQLQTALDRWRTSIRLNPTSAYARVGLGETYLRQGRVDEAIPELEQAVTLAPTQPSPLLLLARAYEQKGERDKALALQTRAREVAAAAAAAAAGPRVVY
jgi:tetratricopeptide (TPR) repeat protein